MSNTHLLLAIFALICCSFNSVYAEVYSWIDSEGNRVFTDKKPVTKGHSTQTIKPSTGSVNYYTAPVRKKSDEKTNKQSIANILSSKIEQVSHGDEQNNDNGKTLNEQDCQKHYQRSCDKIHNWRQYAIEKCGSDPRCQDEKYLERKYRPRSSEEMQAIARRAATRNNIRDKKIALFLKKEYTQYCTQQAALYCKNKTNGQCEKKMEGFCSDSRDLQDIFNQYDNLTLLEKQQIIKKAKQLSITNGKDPAAYKKVLSDIINLLVMQATLGI